MRLAAREGPRGLHVLGGIVLLEVMMCVLAASGRFSARSYALAEAAGLYLL